MSEETEAPQGLPEGEAVSETPATETPAPETGTEQPEKQEEAPKPKHKPWYQERIDQLTREKYDRQRRVEALEAQLSNPGSPETPPTPVHGDPVEAKARELVAKQDFDRRCNDVYSSGAGEYADFDEKLGNFRLLGGLPPQVLDTVTQLPDAHKVLHALGSDLDQAAHIFSLPPVQMAVALARLPTAKTTPVSAAPPPIKPIDGSPRGETDPMSMSVEEWARKRDAGEI